MNKMIRVVRNYLLFRRHPVHASRQLGVQIGSGCRLLSVSASTFGSEPYLVSLGDHVTVTAGVRFITHDGGVWVFRDEYPDIDVIAPIEVGCNVFIGLRAILLPGVTIGNNVVIAAGSIVTRSFGDNVVLAGVPAKVIKSLDAYREAILPRSVATKGLPAEEKREKLMDRFLGRDG